MNYNHVKGALFEFIIRQIFLNSGFSRVIADRMFVFSNNGLNYINGKGAAHDADVLMEPPIQIPFFYPNRVIIECKA